MTSNNERGKLIDKPEKESGGKMRSKKGALALSLIYIFIPIMSSFLLYANISGVGTFEIEGPEIVGINLFLLVPLSVFSIISIVLLAYNGIEIDGIWENGISSSSSMLIDNIKGRTFLSYDNIGKIYHGKYKDALEEDKTNHYLMIVAKNENQLNWSIWPHFEKEFHEDDFFERLKTAIKENAPHAKWIKVEKTFENFGEMKKYFKRKKL